LTYAPHLLTFYVNGNDVDTTIVDGKVLMEGGEVKSVDVDMVLKLARDEAEKAFELVDLEPFMPSDREFWHGTRYEEK
jgi:hypothetical protein